MARGSKRKGGSRWRKLRAMKLSENPLCEWCEKRGQVTLAAEVDHISPIEQAPEREFDYDNLQSLCEPCHDAKTASERSGKPLKGCDTNGVPLDPAAGWAEG